MSHPSTSADSFPRPAPARLAAVSDSNVALVGEPMVGKSGVALDTLEAATEADRDTLLISTARGQVGCPSRTR